jgi:hypothetical protein
VEAEIADANLIGVTKDEIAQAADLVQTGATPEAALEGVMVHTLENLTEGAEGISDEESTPLGPVTLGTGYAS